MDILPQNNKIKCDKNYYIDYIDCYLKSEKSLVKFFKFSLYIIIAGLIILIFPLANIINTYGIKIFDNSFFENTLFMVGIGFFLYVIIFGNNNTKTNYIRLRLKMYISIIISLIFISFNFNYYFKLNLGTLVSILIVFLNLYARINYMFPRYSIYETKIQRINNKKCLYKILKIFAFIVTMVCIMNFMYFDDIHALLSFSSKQITDILIFTFGFMSFFILLGFLIFSSKFLYDIKQINKQKLSFIKGEITSDIIQNYICLNIESHKVIDNMKEKIDFKSDYVLTLYKQIQQNQSLIENLKNNVNSDNYIIELLTINKHKINSAIVILSSIITTYTEKYEQSSNMTKQELIEKTEPYMTMWKWIDSTQKDNKYYISQLKKKVKKNKHK